MSGCLGVQKPDLNNHLESTVTSFTVSLSCFTSEMGLTHYHCSLLSLAPLPTPPWGFLTCFSGPVADKPARPLWSWPYWLCGVLSNLFGSTKGKPEPPTSVAKIQSLGVRIMKSISYPLKGLQLWFVATPSFYILRLRSEVTFLGLSNWLDAELLVTPLSCVHQFQQLGTPSRNPSC